MFRVLQYRLYPTPAQEARLIHFLDVGRRLYNHALEQRIQYYRESGKALTVFEQCGDLAILRSVSQVLADVPSNIERDALRRLDKSFVAFFRRCKAGEKPGFPRFKSALRWKSFSVPVTGRVVVDGRVRLFGIPGAIRARNVRSPAGKPKQLRIIRRADKWYAQLVVDDGKEAPPKMPVKSAVGIDLGLESFATLSTGERIANPRFYRRMERRLRRANRRLRCRRKGGSNRRKAMRLLQKLCVRISNRRSNFTHHLSKQLVTDHQLIAVEDLNIDGLVLGRNSKSILDAAWGQFVYRLQYKAESAGVQVTRVDPKGTSQECSRCGQKVHKELKKRRHECPHCGLRMNRDHNAAINILNRAYTAGRAGINACGEDVRPDAWRQADLWEAGSPESALRHEDTTLRTASDWI